MRKLFSRKRQSSALGMDLGSSGIRLLALRRAGDRFEMDWCETISLLDLDGSFDVSEIAARVRPVLARHRGEKLPVAACLPRGAEEVQVEEMPGLKGDQLQKAAALFFERLPSSEEPKRHHVVGQQPRSTDNETQIVDALMVSARESDVATFTDLVSRLELSLQWLLPRPITHLRLHGETQDAAILHLEIGDRGSYMSIVTDGVVRMVRQLDPGARTAIDFIKRKRKCTAAHAQHVLRGTSVADAIVSAGDAISDEDRSACETALAKLADKLAPEIERSSAYVASRYGMDGARLSVSGGLTGSAAFRSALENAVSIPVGYLDPFGALGIEEDPDLPHAHLYAQALGCAAAALSGERDRLLPWGKPGRKKGKATAAPAPAGKTRPWVRWAAGAAAVLALAAAGAGEFWIARTLKEVTTQRAQVGQQVAAALTELDQVTAPKAGDGHEEELLALSRIYQERPAFTSLFQQIPGALPRDVLLTRLEISFDEAKESEKPEADLRAALEPGSASAEPAPDRGEVHVVLEGQALNTAAVGDAVLSLEISGLMREIETVEIRSSAMLDDSLATTQGFEIRGRPGSLKRIRAQSREAAR